MSWDMIFTSEVLSSFFLLTVLEIILGIDNLVFISILSEGLKGREQKMAQRVGLALALIMRLLFLSLIVWIARLTTPFFVWGPLSLSGRDIILIGGGLFLIFKGTLEIHDKTLRKPPPHLSKKSRTRVLSVITQIALMDIIFSLDSIVTAVGTARHLEVMIAAVIVSIIIMILAVNSVSDFIHHNPTIKMLALSFLLLIGMSLIAEGFDVDIPKGYIYFAMLFSLFVEFLNIMVRKSLEKKKKRRKS